MKEIEIFYNGNGTLLSRINPNLVFDGENNSVIITANFPEEVSDWEKHAYISGANAVETGFFDLGNSNPAILTVSGEYLTEGKCTVGFEACENDVCERFMPLEFYVSGFVNENVDFDEEKIRLSDLFGSLYFDASDNSIIAKTKNGVSIGEKIILENIFALKGQIPAKTSDLTNDSGFLTSHQSLADYVTMQFLQQNFLATSNSMPFTPTGDYNPATKKYVDDTVGSINNALGGVVNGSF